MAHWVRATLYISKPFAILLDACSEEEALFHLTALRATPLGILAFEKAGFTESGEYEKSQTPHHAN
jgi:hypothetical protein